MCQRRLLAFSLVLAVAQVAQAQDKASPKRAPVVLTEEALRLHQDAPVFDGHNDLPWKLREKNDPFFKTLDISREQKSLHTDIPRLKKGGVGAQFWSAYVPADTAKAKTALTVNWA